MWVMVVEREQGCGAGGWDFMLFAVGMLWRAVSRGVASSNVRIKAKAQAAVQSEPAKGGWKQGAPPEVVLGKAQ